MTTYRIACIGPTDSLRIVQDVVAKEFPEVDLLPLVREIADGAWDAVQECRYQADGILFTGPTVHSAAMRHGPIALTHETVPRSDYCLARALWALERSGAKWSRLSLDLMEDAMVAEVLRENGISLERVYNMPYREHYNEPDYEKFHLSLHRQGKVDALLTFHGGVYLNLKRLGLPVYRVYASALQVRSSLDKLLDRITARNLRSAGITVQVIRLKNIAPNVVNQYDDMKKVGTFYLELVDYVRGLQGSLFEFGRQEYIVICTRGLAESSTHLAHMKRLVAWARSNRITVASGIGMGQTAFEAERSARKALARALELPGGGLYIMGGGEMRGPIGDEDELQYPVQVSEERLLKLSGEMGMSATYLAKIMALVAKTGKDEFDSAALASCLGISERSGRRILKKMLDSGHAEQAGKEASSYAGRPKNIVRLRLNP